MRTPLTLVMKRFTPRQYSPVESCVWTALERRSQKLMARTHRTAAVYKEVCPDQAVPYIFGGFRSLCVINGAGKKEPLDVCEDDHREPWDNMS